MWELWKPDAPSSQGLLFLCVNWFCFPVLVGGCLWARISLTWNVKSFQVCLSQSPSLGMCEGVVNSPLDVAAFECPILNVLVFNV